MKIEIKTPKSENKLARDIHATIPAAAVDAAFQARATTVAQQVKIPGFRPGKVPASVVMKKHGEQIAHEATDQLMNEAIMKAAQDNDLRLAGQPHVHGDLAKQGEDFAFHAHVEVFPTIDPKGTDAIKLTKETAKPEASEIDKTLKQIQQYTTNFAAKDGKAADGDRVTITGQGYTQEGKAETAFEGGSLKGFKVTLGSGQTIPGFEEALQGKAAGDDAELKVTFPEDYHATELAGKPAVFKVKVDAVEAAEAGELTDEQAKQFGAESVADLKSKIEARIQDDLNAASEQRMKRELFDHLDAKNTFDLPQNMVTAEVAQLAQQAARQAVQQNPQMDQEAYKAELETQEKEMQPLAQRRVKLGLLLAELAKKQEIQVEPQEMQEAFQGILQQAYQQGGEEEAKKVQQFYSQPQNQQQLAGPILEDKVVQGLLASAKITEKTVKPEELMAELQG